VRQLNRYISTTVSASILMVLLVILGLDAIAAIIDEMGSISGDYDFLAVLQYVALSVPATIFDLLPFAALVGCLAGLGALATNSELVVMRSAGISTGRIVWMVMKPAFIIMIVGMLISEYVAPMTESIAQGQRSIALRNVDDITGKQGLWHREGNDFMHFNAVQPNGIIYGITIYSFDGERQLQKTLSAERAIYQRDYWLLEDYQQAQIGEDKISQLSGNSKIWDIELSPELLNILVLDPLDLSIAGLWRYSNYLDSQGLNSGSYRLAFWKKVLQPLSTLALVLIAISFIFGPLRQVTMGYRIFIGVLVGVVFRTTQDMLAPASLVYGFAPILASLGPIIVCLLAGGWFLKQAK
jgi:lipopolysaccharide export system permease protein